MMLTFPNVNIRCPIFTAARNECTNIDLSNFFAINIKQCLYQRTLTAPSHRSISMVFHHPESTMARKHGTHLCSSSMLPSKCGPSSSSHNVNIPQINLEWSSRRKRGRMRRSRSERSHGRFFRQTKNIELDVALSI